MHVETATCAGSPLSRVRWVRGVAQQVRRWPEGLLGQKSKSTDCPPWPVDQTQITKKWYLYLPRLFDSPFCTGAANPSGLCTLSPCASVLRVSLAFSEINFAGLVVATVTINKLSIHHFVPLDGAMPTSEILYKALNMRGAYVGRGSPIPVCNRHVVWMLQRLEDT